MLALKAIRGFFADTLFRRVEGQDADRDGGGLLRVTFLAGFILLIFTGSLLTAVVVSSGGSSRKERQRNSFSRLLHEYDASAEQIPKTEKDFENLLNSLDRIEKKALGIESWLSVLKRRRSLAVSYPKSADSYRQSAKRAVKAYPWSQPIAAVAAAALIKDRALTNEAEEELRSRLSIFTDPAFNTLRLSLHVLLGDFKNPQRGSQLPRSLYSDGSEIITQNLAVVKVINGDYIGAAADIQTALNFYHQLSDDFVLFAAEYYYDFGDLLRAAQLFAGIEGDTALLRQADALYLAGYKENARSIWHILANSPNERGLYNLAVTSESDEESFSYLEKLVKIPISNPDSRQAGLIRYSRMLPHLEAVAALENSDLLNPRDFPLIDLEIIRRNAVFQEPGRQIAETWLLLDRHPEDENLYQWAAWSIFFQRHYDEAKYLFRREDQYQLAWLWSPLYRAIYSITEGDLSAAKSFFQKIPDGQAGWEVYANRGRILEAELSFSRALENYEIAASLVKNPKTASRLQFRIAKCLAALGNRPETRRVLEYALDLDPDNTPARLELGRE